MDDILPEEDTEPQFDAVENDDGSATVMPVEMPDQPIEKHGFYTNLATVLDPWQLSDCASELIQLIEDDKKSRERRDKQQKDALERSGVAGPAPGGADFQGANKVTHPGLLSIAVDFAARATKELMPPGGPVKADIEEPVTPPEMERGDRIATHMNWQITRQMKEFESEIEQMLTQLPFGGSQYVKAWRDVGLGRNRIEFVAIDDLFLPFSASNFYTAERITHRQFLTTKEIEDRIKSGLYRDVDIHEEPQTPEMSKTGELTLRVEGAEDTGNNEDGLREVYEIFVNWEFNEGVVPYIVTIESYSKQVLAIYRNWLPNDDRKQRLDWIVDFRLLPWRGPVGIGFPQIFAGLPAAVTGALRALLDSAHAQNAPATITQKGVTSVSGRNTNPRPGENLTIQTKTGVPVDDVRKAIIPLQFAGPSQTLLQLLGILKEEMSDVLKMTLDNISDTNQNTPVGTHLSRVEQGLIVYSSIHKRLHQSMARLFEILYRLNSQYLDEKDELKEAGKILATKADYQGPPVVSPVSDPNIFSEFQRLTQSQAILQLQQQMPDVKWNRYETAHRMLTQMKVPAIDTILLPPPKPQPPQNVNPISENSNLMLGMPVEVVPQQDHLDHLMAHFDLLISPIFCQNRMFAPVLLAKLLDHIRKHLGYIYPQIYIESAQQASKIPLQQAISDPNEADLAAKVLVEASPVVAQVLQKTFIELCTQRYGAPMADLIHKAFDYLDTIGQLPANNNPMIQLEQASLEQKQADMQQDAALKSQQMIQQKQIADEKNKTELIKNSEDNETAQNIASLRVFTGHSVGGLKNGESIGEE